MNQRQVESNGSRASEAAAGSIGNKMQDKVQDKLSDAADAARGRLDGARQTAADKLHGAADKVRHGGDTVASVAHGTAEKLASSADYLESPEVRRMTGDLMGVVRKYPGRSIMIAAVFGFVLAWALRSGD